MDGIQKAIDKAIQESINKSINDLNKPIFEFVATYDAGTLIRYINH